MGFIIGLIGYKDPCTQTKYTLAEKVVPKRYFGASVYTIWAHGPLNPKPYGPLIDTLCYPSTLMVPLKESLKEPYFYGRFYILCYLGAA